MRYVIAIMLFFMSASVFADSLTIELTPRQIKAWKSMTKLHRNATNEQVATRIERYLKERAKGYIQHRIERELKKIDDTTKEGMIPDFDVYDESNSD